MDTRPRALLIVPPVYDFALYDLHIAPLGLERLRRWLDSAGYETRRIDALSTDDEQSRQLLGRPKRQGDGTGKLFRRRVPWPGAHLPIGRSFARYGILEGSFRERVFAAFGGAPPDLVLVTSGMTYWYLGVVEAVETVRSVYPGAPVAVGGVYATLLPEHARRATGADVVARGDDLSALGRLLAARGLPVPAGEPSGYAAPSGRGSAAVRLNEGCPYRCDYCASYRIQDRFSEGCADDAFEEVRHLFEVEGVSNFAFYDDALLVSKRRVFHRFLERVAARWPGMAASGGAGAGHEPAGAGARSGGAGGTSRPRFHLPNAVHLRHLDAETARLMREAGVSEVRLGFESDSDTFHRRHDSRRGDGVAAPAAAAAVGGRGAGGDATGGGKAHAGDLERVVSELRGAGYGGSEIGVYVLAGLPGQRREEAEQAVRTAGELGVSVYVSEFSPVPGSALWERCVAESLLPIAEEPLYQNNTLFPMAWEGFTREDLLAVKELAAAYRRRARTAAGPRVRALGGDYSDARVTPR